MEKLGTIELIVSGSKGNFELTPDNYDIRELINMLENAEGLIYSGNIKDRPTISYRVEEGSVRHIFTTAIQFVIAFNAIIGQINKAQNIDFLEIKTARAIENMQIIAAKNNYSFIVKTSLDNSNKLKLDKTTHFYKEESLWVDAEFFFYGKLTNAGGKEKANIHINTNEFGSVTIDTPKDFLQGYKDNLLYKDFGVRASGKQHSETGELDKSSLKFIELIDFEPKYDHNYLQSKQDKARKNWLTNIDPDTWLREIRGYDI